MTLAVMAGLTSATQAAETGFLLSANAYGTQVKVGNVVKSGPTAKSGCGNACGTTQVPAHGENSVLMVTEAPLLLTGVISTSSDVQELNGSLQASSIAEAHDINLLGGLVLADEVTAESTTTHDTLGFHSSANGSSLIGAIVAGNIIAVTPAPNTRINLAGIGYVVLNEQIANHCDLFLAHRESDSRRSDGSECGDQ